MARRYRDPRAAQYPAADLCVRHRKAIAARLGAFLLPRGKRPHQSLRQSFAARQRPLTVIDLSHTRLPDAKLAFLAACTTARTGLLADEPIHLSAACQLAGYRHVVASLWAIDDSAAAALTGRFYATLKSLGTGAEAAARALHEATRLLRALHRRRASQWAPTRIRGPSRRRKLRLDRS